MKRKLTSLALVSAGLLAVALPSASHADVMASAMLNMTNFEILGSNGTRLDADDFSFLTFTITSDQDASLNGVTLSNTGTSPSAAYPTSIDFAPICVGGGCAGFGLTNNSFPSPLAPPAAGNYAAADQLDEGSPITGTVLGDAKSHVAAGSYAGLTDGTAVASVDANNNFNSSFVFQLNQGTGVTFTFDLMAWLQVAVTSDEDFPGFATAAVDMNFSLVDLSTGATVFNYSPEIFGAGELKTLSLNAPLFFDTQICRDTSGSAIDCVQGAAKNFTTQTVALTNDRQYQASFRMNTNADAARVPEPGILALVGMGLLGLGLSRRRKASV